ncbi:glycerol-3-phosphate dehydrogenase/oxidase [Endozoicomonas sp. SCSIO W0465]|uniref:glycerol-3-phosphate dehydrogenase/oxidase n=1 Tax=Endozoicomonas sp. SCSIO W0465 TaxID=2918516 RepID=UPI002074EF26|nr:glycerol-3-phosphate dehydrogenase/oxidase [Endozoicomonas sp. SCSIO W0465]USE34784.1 glycerol-3-phosphate dehydrogenase/oxidase [Endozoicomonas sp. SCSIO W0465]
MWQQSWQAGNRKPLLQALTNNPDVEWDVVVAGGGITGAGIAREAARRGLKVLLVERQDFAWGTSSRSSKMVHGGLRYIASGDIKTTMHSVSERERLMREAPGLVDPMGYLMAHYKGAFPGPLVFNLLLRIYDFFAGKRYRKVHQSHDIANLSPLINDHNLLGATQFADAITDDSRLVIRVLREARKEGATVMNYVGVDALIKNHGRVTGAELKDAETGQVIPVKAKVVINATGAWGDELRGEMTSEQRIRPARGSHIVVPGWRLPVAQAYTVMHPDDQRPVFIFPWEGRTVVGTTDLDNGTIGNHEVAMTREELEYLMKAVCFQFPKAGLTEQDIIASWAGVRPLVSSGALNPSKEKRDHSIWNDNGLVTVSGGKLTTFRLIALDVLKAAEAYLPGVDFSDTGADMFTQYEPASGLFKKLPDYLQKRIRGHYGMDADHLLAQIRPGEQDVIPGARALWAELRWSAGNEAVVHLDDLLLRRTRLGLLLEQGGLIFADRIEAICREELGWSEQKWQQEVARYQSIWNTFYSIPK